MSQLRRLPVGGLIDRGRRLRFSFDEQWYEGFAGDTLAAALLANGVDVVGRGIYSGRPRGILTADSSEPNAIVGVRLGDGSAANAETMLPATRVELEDGLRARSLSGIGRLEDGPDRGHFDRRHRHADVVVVGAGAAGLAAAVAAGGTGARVILADAEPVPGGRLLGSRDGIEGLTAAAWIEAMTRELEAAPEVRILARTTAVGAYDHGYLVLSEQIGLDRGTLWLVRAGSLVLATGATERPIVFADNDRPGIMLAGAARTYLDRFAVRVGERAVVFTTNDTTDPVALDLLDAGTEIVAIVDARPAATSPARDALRARGVPVLLGHAVAATDGNPRLTSVTVVSIDHDGAPSGAPSTLACETLLVSGGWNPAVQLFSQARGTLRYDEPLATFVPDRAGPGVRVAGAANGTLEPEAAVREGRAAGLAAAARFSATAPNVEPPPTRARSASTLPLWLVPSLEPDGGLDRHFVDLARDSHAGDIERGVAAGLRSVEHVKRFTTIGTGPDQGRTSGLLASAIAARLTHQSLPEAGLTSYRPPTLPVSFALLAGRYRGDRFDPIRVTPIDAWHAAHGAVFENAGLWRRPRYFPLPGESMAATVRRESIAARTGVAIMDASTLGKIDVHGPDAGDFLDRIYTNDFSTLAVGGSRYGLMCGLDGMLFDDGVTSRLADDHYFMTTTSGNASRVHDWLEEWLQTEWPELRVHVTSMTEQWSVIVLAGPRSRDVIGSLASGLDVDAAAFPFMTWRDASIAGVTGRVFRISFSGELAYEVYVPSWYGASVWEAAMDAGAGHGITPYGLETLNLLRAEKGFPIVGVETDGSVTPHDLGLGWAVSKRTDFVGRRSLRRPDMLAPDREQLVALLPVDPAELLPEGAQIVEDPTAALPMRTIGHVTSSFDSAALGRTFALAMISAGRSRYGQTVHAPMPDRVIAASIGPAALFDPENLRRDG